MTRWGALQRLLAVAGLGLLGAAGAAAQASPALTLERAEQLATAPAALLTQRESLLIGEHWPSQAFGPLPLALLPPHVASVLHVRARYLDVVLSDLHTGALNEQLAMAYIRFERAAAGGKAGSPESLQLESRYLDLVAKRDGALAWQRGARSLLAVALRVPGQLQSEVDEPEVHLPGPATETSAPDPGSMADGSVVAAERLHAWHLFDSRVGAARSEWLAARKRLQLAEARQDEQRADTVAPAAAGALRMGDAMAAVAMALLDVRRAEYRVVVFHAVGLALARVRP